MPDVKITVGADSSGVNSGLKNASQAVDSFKKTAGNAFGSLKSAFVGLFAVSALQQGISTILNDFGRIQDLSDKFGESAESIQRVGYAAKVSGSDIEAVGAAMQKVNGNALDAISGNEKLQDSFGSLGIDAKKFIDLPMEEKLSLLAKGYQDGGSNAQKMDAIISVLGKSGSELIPLLKGGADELNRLFQEAGVSGDESVKKLADAGDKIDKTFNNLKSAGATALAFLITQVESLWANLNAVGIYLANLPDGFEAASNAVASFREELAEKNKQEEAKPKKKTDIEGLEGKDKAKEESKNKLKGEQDALKELQSAEKNAEREVEERKKAQGSFTVTSLRAQGGGLSEKQSAFLQTQTSEQSKTVDIARSSLQAIKQQIEEAKKQVALLQKIASPTSDITPAGFEE